MKKTSDDNENWVWVGCMCDKAFCGMAKPQHENWKSFCINDCDGAKCGIFKWIKWRTVKSEMTAWKTMENEKIKQQQQWQQQRSVGSKTKTTKHELIKMESGEQNNNNILNYFDNECGN